MAEAPLVREARRNVTLERLPVVEEAQLRPLPPEASASAQVESRRAAEHGASGVRGAWKWYMAAAAVLATAAAGYWPRGSARGLALSATDATGQLHIIWDRSAQAIQHSTGGSVQILDRGVRTEVMLTSKDLRSGSISYARQSGDVELRLVVYQPGRSAVEEMMVSSSLKKRARHPHHRWRPLTQNRPSDRSLIICLLSSLLLLRRELLRGRLLNHVQTRALRSHVLRSHVRRYILSGHKLQDHVLQNRILQNHALPSHPLMPDADSVSA